MSEIVFCGENRQVLTNSLLVAEVFHKTHDKVLRIFATSIKLSEVMGNLILKQQKDAKGDKNTFVLSDVSKDELNKRRISVYQYLL